MTKKIKSPKKRNISCQIKSPEIPKGELMFSFKYLDLDGNTKFSLSKCKKNYLEAFLKRLSVLSKWKSSEILGDRSSTIKSHGINWEKSTEDGFTNLPDHLRDIEPRQFAIDKNNHGRIHGILIDRYFFVIWIDPEHLLCS